MCCPGNFTFTFKKGCERAARATCMTKFVGATAALWHGCQLLNQLRNFVTTCSKLAAKLSPKLRSGKPEHNSHWKRGIRLSNGRKTSAFPETPLNWQLQLQQAPFTGLHSCSCASWATCGTPTALQQPGKREVFRKYFKLHVAKVENSLIKMHVKHFLFNILSPSCIIKLTWSLNRQQVHRA